MIGEYAFEAKLYDRIWGKYDYDIDVRFLDKLFKKYRCRRVLDIGCGTGNHAVRLDIACAVSASAIGSCYLSQKHEQKA